MNQNKIYVGNLSYDTTEDDLRNLFQKHGDITELNLIMDRETGRSKGFAFVSFSDSNAVEGALSLNGTEFQSRTIRVNLAKEGGAKRGGGGNDRNKPRGGGGGRHSDRY